MSELQRELDRLKMRNAELEGRAAEADRLSHLLGFRDAHAEVPMLAARVIGAQSGCRQPHHLSQPRLARRHAARHGRDHAGRRGRQNPRRLSRTLRQVLLLSDKDSGVGALLADYAHARPGARHRRSAAGHGVRQQRREGSARRSRAHLRPGPHLPEGFAGRHGRRSRSPTRTVRFSEFTSSPPRIWISSKKCWCCSRGRSLLRQGCAIRAHRPPPQRCGIRRRDPARLPASAGAQVRAAIRRRSPATAAR